MGNRRIKVTGFYNASGDEVDENHELGITSEADNNLAQRLEFLDELEFEAAE